MNKRSWQQKARADLLPIGRILWWTFTVRIHKDGDGSVEVYRKWHPLSWVMFILLIIPCAIVGEKITDVVRFKTKPYWDDKQDELQWLTHFKDSE